MKKIIVYKIYDKDDEFEDNAKFFTMKGLRNYVLTEDWPKWDDVDPNCNKYSKKEIEKSDEYLFAHLDDWNYSVQRIAILDETNF